MAAPKTAPSRADAQISIPHSLKYWNSIPPTVNGMLGGYPQISAIDLRGSYLFFQKLQKLYPYTPPYPSDPSSTAPIPDTNGTQDQREQQNDGSRGEVLLERGLDVGAGIGRVTSGLLSRICKEIDIVEPIAAFASQAPRQKMAGSGKVGDVHVCSLQDWVPREGRVYDVLWAQWCLGHLTDFHMVDFLKKGKTVLRRGGWVIVKENMSTTMGKGGVLEDAYDELDSSVTRCDGTFRRCFAEAGLRLVRTELQRGFEKGLLPVRFYALRIDER